MEGCIFTTWIEFVVQGLMPLSLIGLVFCIVFVVPIGMLVRVVVVVASFGLGFFVDI